MAKYKVVFQVVSYQECNSAEDAAAFATADLADKYGVALANEAMLHVESVLEPEPVGLDMDEYYKMMALEGREDR